MSKFLSYYDPLTPASFTGLTSFKSTVKHKEIQKLNNWISAQETYTLHRQIKKKFPREKVLTNGINDLWHADHF